MLFKKFSKYGYFLQINITYNIISNNIKIIFYLKKKLKPTKMLMSINCVIELEKIVFVLEKTDLTYSTIIEKLYLSTD